jgi:hypothetical protein
MAATVILLVGKSGKKHSFTPVEGRSLEEELLHHLRHLGEEPLRVEELTYTPAGRNPWERRERPDLLELLRKEGKALAEEPKA